MGSPCGLDLHFPDGWAGPAALQPASSLRKLALSCCPLLRCPQAGARFFLPLPPLTLQGAGRAGAPGLSHFTPSVSPDELWALAPLSSQVPPGVERVSCLLPSSALPSSSQPPAQCLSPLCPLQPCLCCSSGLIESLSVAAAPTLPTPLSPSAPRALWLRRSSDLSNPWLDVVPAIRLGDWETPPHRVPLDHWVNPRPAQS